MNDDKVEEKAIEDKLEKTSKETHVLSAQDEDIRSIGRGIGLENESDFNKYSDQLSRIYDWAKLKGAKSREDMVWSVRQLAHRIGSPKLGNNWAQHISQYAYLEMERIKLDKQLKDIENGD